MIKKAHILTLTFLNQELLIKLFVYLFFEYMHLSIMAKTTEFQSLSVYF